jgi:hypothetical protein
MKSCFLNNYEKAEPLLFSFYFSKAKADFKSRTKHTLAPLYHQSIMAPLSTKINTFHISPHAHA